ncbi:unnamed protein product [Linum trigynum]|uniref:MADS-box domain-containing protein n=1 Tax=Linum trigynum TaxID=586398 RepID=A0AAV2GXF5_9ROSI
MSNPGRRKIPIRKIPYKNRLQVTFSKRRAGLFKKASELCTLCEIEIVVIVFSPAGKAYSFGHPAVSPVVGMFSTNRNQIPSGGGAVKAGDGGPKNAQLAQILTQLELVGQAMKAQQNCWTICPIDELGLDGLVQLRNDLEELKLNIVKQQQMEVVAATNHNSSVPIS